MKLLKTESPYLDKSQWKKVFLAISIMTIILYIIAMIFSLCGSKYFILDYQNEQMDRIENFLKTYQVYSLIACAFLTLEFTIISSFYLKKPVSIIYCIIFYTVPVIFAFIFPKVNSIVYSIFPFIYHPIVILVDTLINKEHPKDFWNKMLKLVIAIVIDYILQIMIFIIKSGELSLQNHIMNLSSHFIYSIEHLIALSVMLFTVTLLFDKEKGDGKPWVTFHSAGSSSQISMKKSQKLNLTKTQKNRLKLLYLKFYLIQLSSFLLLMILPFLLGKVFEFLVMYLAFAVTRYILGFKYSLHYKKEVLCITVGIIVFGILALTVPFFYVVVIIAILLGVSLATLLHLSYKYKGFYMFNKISRPDKFAELYVIMDGDLTPHHVAIMCKHKGLDKEQTNIICDFAEGNKKSYIAKKYNYSEKTIERKINEAIDILDKNS